LLEVVPAFGHDRADRLLPSIRKKKMYAILRGANGRRHEVDFGDEPVAVSAAMSPSSVQITVEALEDPHTKGRFVTILLPREALATALAAAAGRPGIKEDVGARLVED
jgi:hypothetical protein